MSEDPQHSRKKLPPGLHQALDSLGRTSGSSATPAPIMSPVPNRNISSQVTNMNRGHHNNNYNGSGSKDRSSQSGRVEQNQKMNRGSSRNSGMPTSQNHERSDSMGSSAGNNSSIHPSPYSQALVHRQDAFSTGRTRVNNSLMSFGQEVTGLKHLFARTSGVPKNVVDTLGAQAVRLEAYFNAHRTVVWAEFDDLEDRLKLIISERDSLQKMAQKFRTPQRKSSGELDKVTDSLSRSMELSEKHSFWPNDDLSSAPHLTAALGNYDRYVAAQADPYGGYSQSGFSPAMQGSVFKGPPKLRNIDSHSNRSLNARRPNISANLQGGYPPSTPSISVGTRNPFNPDHQSSGTQMGIDILSRGPLSLMHKGHITTEPPSEPGDDPGGRSNRTHSSALVSARRPLLSSNAMTSRVDILAPEFQSNFARIYRLIDGFVTSYTVTPSYEADRAIASSNESVWTYMLNLIYPGQIQDSHTHVMLLLGDSSTRPRFMMRVIVDYCISNIMNINNWYGFSPEADATLNKVKHAQEERGLLGAALQRLVEKKSHCVQTILDSSDLGYFRSKSMTKHTRALRNMVGPMLDINAHRTKAGKDVGVICNACWDLSAKMFTSNMTFLCTFPLTNGKFQSATMNVLDLPDSNPLELQVQQARLKLVITPVVVMRDDSRTAPVAKDLHKANVLIMR